MASKGLKNVSYDDLICFQEDILKEIGSSGYKKDYFDSELTNTLTPMHVLVALDDFETIQKISSMTKWKALPNKLLNENSLTPFGLALMRGFVKIAALYLI